MNKHYALLLSFSLFLAPSNTVNANALTYTPVVSDSSKVLVGGAGLTVGTALFFWLNAIRAQDEDKGYHNFGDACLGTATELCTIAFSPFKALLSVVGIKTKSIKYPSARSYFNLTIAALSAYLTAKFAFTFTPEYAFSAAQKDLKKILNNSTAQALIKDQDNLLKNINTTFIENDRPVVAGHSYLLSIRKALKNTYDKLTGAGSIQDTTAQKYLADMKHITHTQIESTGNSIAQIIESPGWESALTAAQEAADRAQEMYLLQKRIDCENSKSWAMHRQADAAQQAAHAHWHAQWHDHHGHCTHTPVAYPPAY